MKAEIECLYRGANPVNTLVIFPYGGGSPLDFRAWKSEAFARFAVYVVCYPGHGKNYGNPLAQEFPSLLDAVAVACQPLMGANTLLFGHSLGAITAFELCRRLAPSGFRARHLFVSGLRAPHLPRRNAPIHQYDNDAFDKALIAYGGLPEMVTGDRHLMNFVRPLQRAAFRIWENYTFVEGPSLACPLTAIAATEDEHYPAEVIKPWSHHSTGEFAFHTLPGGHIHIHDNRERIVALIREAGL